MRSFHFFALPCVIAFAACASSDGPPAREPLKLELSINASFDVNPDDSKLAAPILVRVYELKNADVFNETDFYSLQSNEKSVLADDLLVRDKFLLRPGERKSIVRDANTASTTLGVIAEFRDLPHSIWRATWPLPTTPSKAWYRSASELKLVINLDADAIKISDAQSPNK
jgi:type VI secretion system protein VasD